MKVFEVKMEYSEGDNKEIITQVLYVTEENNSIANVTAYMTKECEQLQKDLKSVREVLSIVEHIGGES